MTHHLDRQYFGYRKKNYIYAPNQGELTIYSPAGTITISSSSITLNTTNVVLNTTTNTFKGRTHVSGNIDISGNLYMMPGKEISFGGNDGISVSGTGEENLWSGNALNVSSAAGWVRVAMDGWYGFMPVFSGIRVGSAAQGDAAGQPPGGRG